MADYEKIISTSYKRFLNHVSKLLGLLDPLYGRLMAMQLLLALLLWRKKEELHMLKLVKNL